jgi:hypothetical protein
VQKVRRPSRIPKADVPITDTSPVHFDQEVGIGQLLGNYFQMITARSYKIFECEHHVPEPGLPLVFKDLRRKAPW